MKRETINHFGRKRILSLVTAIMLLFTIAGCASNVTESTTGSKNEKNGEGYILFTSDVHCGIDQGFGYAGLQQIRDSLEGQGYETLLVDDGDAIQGETIGTLSKGEAVLELMNALKYDAAIPGNHEFDYGMERFLELAEKAEFPYVSCNFNREGKLVFKPYIIKECAGSKIAFVGVTTPGTIHSSTPAFFQNKAGKYIYGFMQDETGEKLYNAVQKAVDAARAEGADLVYLIGHLGYYTADSPWTYSDVIEHTNGIDVVLDGHSHDTEQVEMKNKDGKKVTRSACGTKLNCIGYSHISSEKQVVETGIWSWPNDTAAPELLNIQNNITTAVGDVMKQQEKQLGEVIAKSNVDLLISDPTEEDTSGNPVRMVRRAETNLGDFCADAIRSATKADVALIGGAGIRENLSKGEITYGDVINVEPFANQLCVIRATGQQILDALEWGARMVPEEFGAFFQVSGMRYEIDAGIPSGCKENKQGTMDKIKGKRRVKNVYIGDSPLDPDKIYTVSGADYWLLNNGDGITAFDRAEVVNDSVILDSEAMINYIVDTLHGEIGDEYADPYGQERITIVDK